MTAPSPYRFASEPATGDPVVTCVRSCGVFRCPIRFLDPPMEVVPRGLVADRTGRCICPAWRSVSAAFATANPLATGNWDSGNTAFTMHTLPCALHRPAAPDFETFPDMLWSRSSFEVSVVSDTGKSGRKSQTSRLHSFEHSFLLHATTAHALRVTIPRAKAMNARRRRSVPLPALRRRYAEAPAGAFLTGLASASGLRCAAAQTPFFAWVLRAPPSRGQG